MTDIGFDRTNTQRRAPPPGISINSAKRARLNRITHRSARPMKLHIANLLRTQPGISQRACDHVGLSRFRRNRDTGMSATRIDRTTPDNAINPVTRMHSVSQRFQHNHPTALATHIPISTRIEDITPPVRGKRIKLRRPQTVMARQNQIHTTSQRNPTLPTPQTLTRQMNRHQRRRLAGIDGQTRPRQTQRARNAISDQTPTHTGMQIRTNLLIRNSPHQIREIISHHTQKDTHRQRRQPINNNPGILEPLPTQLQRQTLLRIHRRRLPRRNPKKPRIKLITTLNQTRPPHTNTPTPRNHINRIHTITQQTPQPRQIRRTRKTTRHPHNRDEITTPTPRRIRERFSFGVSVVVHELTPCSIPGFMHPSSCATGILRTAGKRNRLFRQKGSSAPKSRKGW